MLSSVYVRKMMCVKVLAKACVEAVDIQIPSRHGSAQILDQSLYFNGFLRLYCDWVSLMF